MGGITAPAPLTPAHRLAGFDCGRPSLNEWLLRYALRNEHAGGSRTYVVCDVEAGRVVGYYALAAGSVDRAEAPGPLRRNMPDPIPAIVLGRLAVDRHFSGRGIGAGLLKDALLRSVQVANQIGARALLVQALDDSAAAFYQHHGFVSAVGMANTWMVGLG